jgi:hypothetical protein
MESDQKDARFNLHLDPLQKKRLTLYALSLGKTVSEVMNDFIAKELPSEGNDNDPELERKQLEAELDDVDRQISKLQSGKRFQQLKDICEALARAYPQIRDFREIRLHAVSDFRASRLPIPNIEREQVIAEACQQGARLAELNAGKQQLEKKLTAFYGIKLEKPATKHHEQAKEEQEVDWPIYAVQFIENDTWIERNQVAEAGPGAIVYTFRDGKRGLVYEAKGVDLSMCESLSVPRLLQVDPNVAKALKRQLREAAAALRLDQDPS